MPNWFRGGFYGGLSFALLIGLFLIWLWQPERQVARHTENFLHAVERKDWSRGFRVNFSTATVNVDHRRATWIAKITVQGAEGEVMAEVKERVNSLTKPFELEWRRTSAKPWDWKLARVSNPDLEIPAGFE